MKDVPKKQRTSNKNFNLNIKLFVSLINTSVTVARYTGSAGRDALSLYLNEMELKYDGIAQCRVGKPFWTDSC